jgi:hypothetical protein
MYRIPRTKPIYVVYKQHERESLGDFVKTSPDALGTTRTGEPRILYGVVIDTLDEHSLVYGCVLPGWDLQSRGSFPMEKPKTFLDLEFLYIDNRFLATALSKEVPDFMKTDTFLELVKIV